MKQSTPAILILLFFFVCSLTTWGQKKNYEGYVVTLAGDTLRGTVKHKTGEELKEKIFIRVSEEEKHFFKIEELNAFASGDEYYVVDTLIKGEERVPIRIIANGYLKLMEYQTLMQQGGNAKVKYELYCYHSQDLTYTLIRNSGWKKQLEEWFSENTELLSQIRNNKIKLDDLKDLFDQHNRWIRIKNGEEIEINE
jgi:hypothetical protein